MTLAERLRKWCEWQRVKGTKIDNGYPYHKHLPDCEICQGAERIEELEAKHPCKWYQEDDIDSRYYRTGCGVSWEFTFDGPKENGMKFCHNCGKPVSEIPVQEDKE